MEINNPLWSRLIEVRQHSPMQIGDKEFVVIRFFKGTINFIYKSVITLSMLVSLVATPFFWCRGVVAKPLTEDRVSKGPTILEFYQGQPNDKEVKLEDIWEWDDSTLESRHDFIQWLFPIDSKSQFNASSPPTNLATREEFQKDSRLQKKMCTSFKTMLKFYGFELNRSGNVVKASNFANRAKNWLNRGNHNHLRISRILRSLSLHGMKTEAREFLDALNVVYQESLDKIGDQTYQYWQSAIQ